MADVPNTCLGSFKAIFYEISRAIKDGELHNQLFVSDKSKSIQKICLKEGDQIT